MRRLLLVATLTAITPWAVAQRTSSGAAHSTAPVSAPAHADASAAFIRGLIPRPNSEGFRRFHPSSPFPSLLSAFGLFPDSFYPNDSSAPDSSTPAYPPAGQSPNILLQALSPAAASQDQQQPTSQPLLIELQGGRYVRVTGENLTGENTSASGLAYQAPTTSTASSDSAKLDSKRRPTHEVTARVLAPVILVFRDGHSEEVRDYTIADGAIYARGDYYSDGYWNKKIELFALNLPETVKSNQERGVHFVLPSAPNEVITRP
jgi:hypothetical protein